MGLSSGFYTPIDVYLVNPKTIQSTRDNYHAIATFDLCMADCKLKHGQVTLYRYAHDIVLELTNYLGDPGWGRMTSQLDVPSWMGGSAEDWDRIILTAIDQLCKRQGLSFAGLLESRMDLQ